ncbi:hypothetical protein ATPR_0694 [Acetobacter tropicalis NBRC 101654]|uniref:Uncharacterized protein n=1 Tax=Acetobacter tropicalis NBRC 101654 TaxID=749388 RepID=F7VBF0_9PROT|nr:hypothetical protein ATPR_0694 [Acetobacter tropicalis NBRC 101654]
MRGPAGGFKIKAARSCKKPFKIQQKKRLPPVWTGAVFVKDAVFNQLSR